MFPEDNTGAQWLEVSSLPLFTLALRSGFKPEFESGSTGIDPGCIHTGGKVVVVNNGIPEGNNDIATFVCKCKARRQQWR